MLGKGKNTAALIVGHHKKVPKRGSMLHLACQVQGHQVVVTTAELFVMSPQTECGWPLHHPASRTRARMWMQGRADIMGRAD
eukprot:1159527-Pelagomonas_calceolata.AAC.5